MKKLEYEKPQLNIDKFASESIMSSPSGVSEEDNTVLQQMLERQRCGWFDL
jgi:hypothetical protein